MTREEWLESISADTGIPVEQLLAKRAARGRYPVPCECGEGICQGWAWSDPDDVTAADLREIVGPTEPFGAPSADWRDLSSAVQGNAVVMFAPAVAGEWGQTR